MRVMIGLGFGAHAGAVGSGTRGSAAVVTRGRVGGERARGGEGRIRVARRRVDARANGENEAFTNADAFSALRELKKTSDPFAASASRSRAAPRAPASGGFVKAGVDVARLPTTRDAETLLRRFDETQRRQGDDAALTACERPAIEQSTRALASRSSRVMLGICAASAEEGLKSLRTWTTELALPRGKLHGMDRDGVPVDPPKGAVFIKYNSLSGDAYISGYGGTFRGVLFTPELDDGAFRQFGYLPLDVLNSE